MSDRDDSRATLQVPVVFEDGRGGVGESSAVQHALRLRAAHNTLRQLQFNPVADIVRFVTIDAGDPAVDKEPRTQEDRRLHEQPVEVGAWRYEEGEEAGEKRRRSERDFVLYGLPERRLETGERVANVLLTDQIRFDGGVYDVVSVDFERHSGRTVARGRLRATSSITVGRGRPR